MVDDAILQQSLAQVNPFLRVSRLTNFHQPRHKLTEETKITPTHWRRNNAIGNESEIPSWRLSGESFEFTLDNL